jgi:hypothetical protein
VVSLPDDLQQVITQAHRAMARDANRELRPFYRRGIYNALETTGEGRGRDAPARLALITARRVLPLWQRERPDDALPSRLVRLTEDVLNGVAPPTAGEVAGEAWEQLEALSEAGAISDACFFAGEAARAALGATLGWDPFDGVFLSTHETDADLDPWCSDTAKWAATAWAGGTWEPGSDPVRRQEFWHWWLTEAVPQAWRASVER